jgi:hypothetical protein
MPIILDKDAGEEEVYYCSAGINHLTKPPVDPRTPVGRTSRLSALEKWQELKLIMIGLKLPSTE